MRRIEWLSRIAAIVLTAVLLSSTAFAVETAALTRRLASRVSVARTLTDDLRTAQHALVTEQSLEREYRLSPEGPTFVAHRVAANKLVAALQSERASSDAGGRQDVDRILAAHRTYLLETRRLFVATNRGDSQLLATLQRDRVDPVFDEIDEAIDARAKIEAAAAARVIAQLHDAQNRVLDITVTLSLIGIACLGCFLGIGRTYRKRLEESHEAEVQQFAKAALLDPLTGIGNHRAYKLDLLREVARARRHDEDLALALLDVDDFKVVNDRDGHMHGDRVLATLAQVFACLRKEDRAYRVGGDEFALILPHTTVGGAKEVVERLQLSLGKNLFGNTLSIGLAALRGSACVAEVLQTQADAAMYAGKRSGRNAFTTFDETLDGMFLLSPAKVQNLRRLIGSSAMHVVYQPIWDLQHCRILAYEALSRPAAEFGFSGPQEAFDLAERVGRVHELDAVCRQAAFAGAAALPADALLFINVSPQSLNQGRLDPNELAHTVRRAGLAPSRIVIELTERSITQVEAVITAALALQKHGFRLALDDTGAGNSGLEMLSRLPLEFVKIDREVVVKALSDKKARAVVAGILAIADATDAYVIAEGIETTEMLEFVCSAISRKRDARDRVHGVQGYLLHRPRETFLAPAESAPTETLLRKYAGSGEIAPARGFMETAVELSLFR